MIHWFIDNWRIVGLTDLKTCFFNPTIRQSNNPSLKGADIHARLNVMIIAIKRAEEPMLFNPAADTIMYADDALIAMGSHDDLEALTDQARPNRKKTSFHTH